VVTREPLGERIEDDEEALPRRPGPAERLRLKPAQEPEIDVPL
jgi:hypothetical protein